MQWLYDYYFPALWLTFLVYWQVKSVRAKTTTRMEPAWSRILRSVAFLCAIALFLVPRIPVSWLYRPFLPSGSWSFFAGAVIATAGLLFAVWARVHLGTNWSRSVTIKQGHELITTGPYALVRHPIYTGLLAGFLGSAIATAQLRGLVALLLVFLALWMKLRLEEQWMRSQFGPTYTMYARHTAALVPWIL